MTKAIAVTQQGNETIFMIGDYQATLEHRGRQGWHVQYFKKSKGLFSSDSKNHPVMPSGSLSNKGGAEEVVKAVLRCLDSGSLVTTSLPIQLPKPTKRPSRSRGKAPKVMTAYQVIDRLLNLLDDTCTVLVPMGKPAALKLSKVRIVDSEGETLCEIPYSIFQGLL